MGTQEADKSILVSQHACLLPSRIPFVRRAVGVFFAVGVLINRKLCFLYYRDTYYSYGIEGKDWMQD